MSSDALVVGRSLPALLAALDLAEVGLTVVVAGGPLELPEGGERDPGGSLAAAFERIAAPIGESGSPADTGSLPAGSPVPAARLLDPAGAWAPQPDPAVWGIPAVALSEEMSRLLGSRAAVRAHMDRLMPRLSIRRIRSIGELVRRRLGREVLERLTEPMLRERYGVSAEEVDASIAAPGLGAALSRTGALTSAAAAYAERYVARETTVRPAAGWAHLADALLRRLEAYGVELIDAEVEQVARRVDQGWHAVLDDDRRIEARSLVVDPGRERGALVDPDGAAARIAALLPVRERVYAGIDIRAIDGFDAEGAGSVAVRSLGDWSLRIASGEAGHRDGAAPGARATLSSPVLGRGEELDASDERLGRMLTEAGLEAAADASWSTHRYAAPFPTVAERDDRAAGIAAHLAEQPDVLPLGRALHGDDLAAAITAAHAASVALRRDLLGLSE